MAFADPVSESVLVVAQRGAHYPTLAVVMFNFLTSVVICIFHNLSESVEPL